VIEQRYEATLQFLAANVEQRGKRLASSLPFDRDKMERNRAVFQGFGGAEQAS